MRTPTLRPHRASLALGALIAALAAVFIAGTAVARIVNNTIDPVAVMTGDGRQVIVTGPIECTAGERTFIRITLTQRSTAAFAEGRGVLTCTGSTQQWEVDAPLQGKEVLVDGPAIAVAVARSTDHGQTTDAHQWLVDVTLVTE